MQGGNISFFFCTLVVPNEPLALFGTAAKIDVIKDICDRHGATLIEDAAEALGSYYNSKKKYYGV